MHRSQKSLKPSPSIHNIIIEDQELKLNNQIKEFFKSQPFPIFPLAELLGMPQFSTDQRFFCLVRELQEWNKRVEANSILPDSRAELYRNKFIYTQLKNLVFRGNKVGESYETNLTKLYDWWRKNSKEQMPIYLGTNKSQKQDDEWQVRKTFKSNMPLELKNYQRRALFASQDNLQFFQSSKQKENCDQKLVNYLAVKEYNSKQLKLREAREEQEIENGKTLLKSKKCRFLEDNCHNIQLYQGTFNQCSKTSVIFRKTHKPSKNGINMVNRPKNSNSVSILEKEKEEIEKIKKYRFNSALNKKRNMMPEPNVEVNKTSKTFTTTKPFEGTSSDLGTNLLTTRKESVLRKGFSLGVDEAYLTGDKQENENRISDFMEFMELGNWDGERLMSNPFDKKKPLKKGKKKSG